MSEASEGGAPDSAPLGGGPEPVARSNWGQLISQACIAVALIVASIMVASYFMSTKPRTERRKRKRGPTLVEVTAATSTSHQAVLDVSGTVMPSREVTLFSRVAGEIVAASPELVPGGVIVRGAEIVRIDSVDYQLAIAQAASALAQARANVQLEQGNQAVARDEYALLVKSKTLVAKTDKALVLRKPQLAVAKAAVAAAVANLRRAQVDLARTRARSPFDAIVRTRAVDVGSRVTPTTALATLAGIQTWWIEVPVPRSQLRWLTLPNGAKVTGSRARIYDEAWPEGQHREGTVVRVAPDVEDKGRLARVLIAGNDPQSREPGNASRPKLLLGSWVRVSIHTKQMAGVVAVRRSALHDGDRVWVMTKAGTLDIRKVVVEFRSKDTIFVSKGLATGERIVLTNLAAPVQGMALRTGKARPADAGPETAKSR